jgi:predicted Zn-dependent protease
VADGILKMFIYDSITAIKSREKIIEGMEEGFYVTGLRGSGTEGKKIDFNF